MFSILGFRLKDLFDIIIVAILLYQIYRLMKGTSGMNIFISVLSFIVIWFFVSYVFQMELLGAIMNKVVNVGAILLIVLFQDEIRTFLNKLGGRHSKGLYAKIRHMVIGGKGNRNDAFIDEIVQAAESFSKTKTGALIVIQKEADLTNYWETGERIDSEVRARLMENIFYKNTPLHDGALIIVGGRIKAVGCILPISHDQNIPQNLGLRHRAALGISEKTDADVVVVSEENGKISYAEKGKLKIGVKTEELLKFLTKQ